MPDEPKKTDKDEKPSNIRLLAAAMLSGLSIPEIRLLTMGETLSLLEIRFAIPDKKESNVREATQADIDAFLS